MNLLTILTLLFSTALFTNALPTSPAPTIQHPETPAYYHIMICTAPWKRDCIMLAMLPSPRGGKRNCGNMLDKFNDSITSLYPVEPEAEWWIYADPECGGKFQQISSFGLDDLRVNSELNDLVTSLAVWKREGSAEDEDAEMQNGE